MGIKLIQTEYLKQADAIINGELDFETKMLALLELAKNINLDENKNSSSRQTV